MATTRRRARKAGEELVLTSLRLPRSLLARARIHAIRTRTTLRAMVEQALRDVLARKEGKP